MIISRGFGIFTIFIPPFVIFTLVLVADVITGRGSLSDGQARIVLVIGLLISALLLWFLGRTLNMKPARVLTDPETGEQVELRQDHSLFFIKMEYWGIILALLTILFLLASLFS